MDLDAFYERHCRRVTLGGAPMLVFEGAHLHRYLLDTGDSTDGHSLLKSGVIQGVPHTDTFTADAYWYTRAKASSGQENQGFQLNAQPSPTQLVDVYNQVAALGSLSKVSADQCTSRDDVRLSLSSFYSSMRRVESLVRPEDGAGEESPRLDYPLDGTFDPFSHSVSETMSWQRSGHGDSRLRVPTVVYFLARAVLSMEGLTLEGLFRKSPSDSEKRAWKAAILRGQYARMPPADDAHLAAVLLKQFFLELPEALIPDYHRAVDSAKTWQGCLDAVASLPADNFHTLSFLISFLRLVSRHSKATKMDARNLCMVFSPCVLHATEMTTLDMEKYRESLQSEQYFLNHLIDHLPSFPLGAAAVGRQVRLKLDGELALVLEATTGLHLRVSWSGGEKIVHALNDIAEFIEDGAFDPLQYLRDKYDK